MKPLVGRSRVGAKFGFGPSVRLAVGAAVSILGIVGWSVGTGVAWAETSPPSPTVAPATQLPPDPIKTPISPGTYSSEQIDSPEPTVEPTETAEPESAPTLPPETTAQPEPPILTAEPEPPGPTAQPEASSPERAPTIGVLEAVPPVWQTTQPDPWSWGIALVVLVIAATFVLLLSRRPDPRESWAPEAVPATVRAIGSTQERLAGLEAVGEAMTDAGYSVSGIHSALTDIAHVNGFPETEIVVLPTALFVSARGQGEVRTGAVSSGHFPLRLDQIDALDDVIHDARTRPSDPAIIKSGIEDVRGLQAPYSTIQRVAAHSLLSASLSVLLGASWVGLGVAAALGLVVGVLLMVTREVKSQYRSLVTVGVAFLVAGAVFALARIGLDPGVLPALIAPLITFLPGGLLTTGVIELATGQMMAGAGRLAAGGMQLIMLAAGVIAGASLVGVPHLDLQEAQYPLGTWGPWLAVATFGLSTVIFRCGRPRTIVWTLLVLYVAFGAQVLGGLFFGGVLSAMIGAFAMTPVAYLVSRQPSGPAAFASFLPAFWMLVPGTLGVVGVASLLSGDSTGLTTLVVMTSTMVAITLGILIGSALGGRLARGGTVEVI